MVLANLRARAQNSGPKGKKEKKGKRLGFLPICLLHGRRRRLLIVRVIDAKPRRKQKQKQLRPCTEACGGLHIYCHRMLWPLLTVPPKWISRVETSAVSASISHRSHRPIYHHSHH